MDINGWLTVITIVLAIMAIMPKEELKHLQITLPKIEVFIIAIVLFAIIPITILFYELSDFLPFLKRMTVSWGMPPALAAFILLYIFIIWLLIRLFFLKLKNTINDKLVDYYKELLYQKPFDDFAVFFLKYNNATYITKNWKHYRLIILDAKFLQGLGNNSRVSYFTSQFVGLIKNKNDFKTFFSIFLEREDSILYEELKLNPSAYSISETPLLFKLLKENLYQSIKLGLLEMIEDYTVKCLGKQELVDRYNQPFKYPANSLETGHDFPTYFHLRLIELIYETAIVYDIKIQNIRQTLMQTILDRMLSKVEVKGLNLYSEYQSNYFYLINKLFDIHGVWGSKLAEQRTDTNFDEANEHYGDEDDVENKNQGSEELLRHLEESHYVDAGEKLTNAHTLMDYVNFSYGLCLSKLTESSNSKKVPKGFVETIGHYYFLTIYFRYNTVEEYLDYMESQVLNNLSPKVLVIVIGKTLNEVFSKDIYYFVKGKFSKKPRLQRLFNFLNRIGKIDEMKDWLDGSQFDDFD